MSQPFYTSSTVQINGELDELRSTSPANMETAAERNNDEASLQPGREGGCLTLLVLLRLQSPLLQDIACNGAHKLHKSKQTNETNTLTDKLMLPAVTAGAPSNALRRKGTQNICIL